MPEDRGQRTESLCARRLASGTADFVTEVLAAACLVCRLSSVYCSLEIVKRVVTVKQVRPSFLISSGGGEVGPGHGYVLADARASAGAVVCAQFQDQRAESGDQTEVRAFRLSCLKSAL
jgi:hypothetical protein